MIKKSMAYNESLKFHSSLSYIILNSQMMKTGNKCVKPVGTRFCSTGNVQRVSPKKHFNGLKKTIMEGGWIEERDLKHK